MTDYDSSNITCQHDVRSCLLDDQLIDITPNVTYVDGYRESMRNSFCTRCRAINHSLRCASHSGTKPINRSISVHNSISDANNVDRSSSANQFSFGNFRDDAPLINNYDEERSIDNGVNIEFGSSVPDHCHITKPSRKKTRTAVSRLIIACFLTTCFMVCEIIGGYLANSIAVMSDAAHLLSDLTSFIVSLVAMYLAVRPASKKMNYGYQRAEVLGAVVSVLIIWLITGVLVYIAVERIITMEFEVEGDTMIVISALGVVFNIILGFVLHTSGHGHSHGPSGHRGEHTESNINIRAAFIHVVGDFVQSVGVLLSAYIIRYYPNAKIADPICTFLFSVIVMFTTFPILKDLSNVLMEGIPPGVDYNVLCSNLAAIPGVKMVHSLHVWALTLDKNALSVHLAISGECDSDTVLKDAQRMIRQRHLIGHTTIQVETYQPQLMDNCIQCQPLD